MNLRWTKARIEKVNERQPGPNSVKMGKRKRLGYTPYYSSNMYFSIAVVIFIALMALEGFGTGGRRMIKHPGGNGTKELVVDVQNIIDNARLDRTRPYSFSDRGILYAVFTQGTREKDSELLKNILSSAQILQNRTQTQRLPVALITDLNISAKERAFLDHIIVPNQSIVRREEQMSGLIDTTWDALWHLEFSPFHKTLFLPVTTALCADVAPLFDALDNIDLVIAGSIKAPYVDPSLLIFKKGSGFDAFAEVLKQILPISSAPTATDLAIRTLYPRCRAGVLTPNGFLGPANLIHSQVVRPGPVYMVSAPSLLASKALCGIVNSDAILRSSRTVDTAPPSNQKDVLFTAHSRQDKPCLYFDGACTTGGDMGEKETGLLQKMIIPFGNHSRQHNRELTSADALADKMHHMNLTYGFSFFGYSTDPNLLTRYVKEVEKAAWGCKFFNPRTKIVLFTNKRMAPRLPFDDIVHMPDEDIKPTCCKRNETWNIMARVQYHRHSPYNLTVQIDVDREVYGDLSQLFRWLADEYDILGVSAGDLPNWDLGVFGLRKGPAAYELLRAWETKMKEYGHEGIDDQYSFTRVRDRIPGLRTGFLNPRWQLKYGPPKGFSNFDCNGQHLSLCNVTRTLVMTGPVMIGVGFVHTLDQLLVRSHELGRDRQNASSVYVHDMLEQQYLRADSQSACDKITRGQCIHPEINWKSAPYEVLNLTGVKGTYPKISWDVV